MCNLVKNLFLTIVYITVYSYIRLQSVNIFKCQRLKCVCAHSVFLYKSQQKIQRKNTFFTWFYTSYRCLNIQKTKGWYWGGERAAKVSHAQIASLNERVSKRVIFRLLSVHNSKVRFREHYNGSFYSFCTRQYESYICARH